MADFIDESNVFDIWELAESISSTDLCRACNEYVGPNFETILGVGGGGGGAAAAADSKGKNRLLSCPPHIFEEILKSRHLLIRDPITRLPSYADDREKSVIRLIKEYCAFDSGRSDMAPNLLQKCVNWMHLAGSKADPSLEEGFDERAADVVKKMLSAAVEGIDRFSSFVTKTSMYLVAMVYNNNQMPMKMENAE